MKRFLWLLLLALPLSGQVLYEEHFTGGQTQLDWHAFFGLDDTMAVIQDNSTPEGDGWVGQVTGFAAMAYAGSPTLTDYSVEAWVYTVVDPTTNLGPYNGLTIRARPLTFEYYYFAAEFDQDQRLRLYYAMIPDSGMPVLRNLRVWTASEIPGGVPTQSSWHKLKIKAVGDSLWAYFDDQLLPGCPIVDTDPTALTSGYFGVYAYQFSGAAETRVDGLVVRQEPYAVAEDPSPGPQPLRLWARPTAFSRATVLQGRVQPGEAIPLLEIYDATGRRVQVLRPHRQSAGTFGVEWRPIGLPAGVYRVHMAGAPPLTLLKLPER